MKPFQILLSASIVLAGIGLVFLMIPYHAGFSALFIFLLIAFLATVSLILIAFWGYSQNLVADRDRDIKSLIREINTLKAAAQRPYQNVAIPVVKPPPPLAGKLRYADYVEFTNYTELKKFENLPAITEEQVSACDPDELMKELMGGEEGAKT